MPGSRLCLMEREEIRAGLERGDSFREIAGFLGRCPSTVCREVMANGGRDGYRAVAAGERAFRLGSRPKPFKLVENPVLARAVTVLLTEKKYSPQTAARILTGQGDTISHETIYQACYQRDRGLGPDVWKSLPRRRQRRKHAGRPWGLASGHPLGEFVSIHDRDPAAASRSEKGHLEGDLLIGANNLSAVICVTDRLSRFTLLGALPDGYRTGPVCEVLTTLLESLPPDMRKTLTWDQGGEMRNWTDVQAKTGTRIYFCDPRSPWQKPTVENTNGILRRWLPKGTPLDVLTQSHLDTIASLINNMPRGIHGWKTAKQVYDSHRVATTT